MNSKCTNVQRVCELSTVPKRKRIQDTHCRRSEPAAFLLRWRVKPCISSCTMKSRWRIWHYIEISSLCSKCRTKRNRGRKGQRAWYRICWPKHLWEVTFEDPDANRASRWTAMMHQLLVWLTSCIGNQIGVHPLKVLVYHMMHTFFDRSF